MASRVDRHVPGGVIALNAGVARLVQGSGYTLWYVIALGLHVMAVAVCSAEPAFAAEAVAALRHRKEMN